MRFTLEKLFEAPMNTGYPVESAERKKRDAVQLKAIKKLAQTDMLSVLTGLEEELVSPIFRKGELIDFILENGTNSELTAFLRAKIK